MNFDAMYVVFVHILFVSCTKTIRFSCCMHFPPYARGPACLEIISSNTAQMSGPEILRNKCCRDYANAGGKHLGKEMCEEKDCVSLVWKK
jgi:hypothetical protein